MANIRESYDHAKDKLLDMFLQARPIQVITLPANRDSAPEFKGAEFVRVLENGSVQGLPVVVICITGPMRTGKSFLLNLLVNYLHYSAKHGSDSGWKSSKLPVRYGAFQRGALPKTRGIWIWDHPFIVDSPNGKVAFLLMDSQGLGDSINGDTKLDNLILYIALELSTVLIWNSRDCFTAVSLDKLGVCADFAKVDADGKSLFDSIFFVIQNWNNDDEFGRRKDLLDEHLKEGNSDVMNKTKIGIKRAFRTRECYTLEQPGRTVSAASDTRESSLDVHEISKDSKAFVDHVTVLFKAIVEHSGDTEERMSGKDLMVHFKTLGARMKALADEDLIYSTDANALEDAFIARASKSAQKLYHDGIMELATSSDPMSDVKLGQAVNDLVRDAKDQFNKATSYYQESAHKPIYQQVLKKLWDTLEKDIDVLRIVRRLSEYKRLDKDIHEKDAKTIDAALLEYLKRNAELPDMCQGLDWLEKLKLNWVQKTINKIKKFFRKP